MAAARCVTTLGVKVYMAGHVLAAEEAINTGLLALTPLPKTARCALKRGGLLAASA